MNIQPVILCGGSGTRLWPLSRTTYPKHLMALFPDSKTGQNQSLFQLTLSRIQKNNIKNPIIVSNETQRFLVAEQLRQMGFLDHCKIILEPSARNTAAAVALAAHFSEPDDLMVVLPADHLVPDFNYFQSKILESIPYAQNNKLVTFGITPTHPHTGYGYIQPDLDGVSIKKFIEKPDLQTAQNYLKNGFLWNSGMFAFKSSVYLNTLNQTAPKIAESVKLSLKNPTQDLDFIRIDSEAFSQCPDIAIDVAVMEKTDQGVVLPFSSNWNDVGAWDSLADALKSFQSEDENHNLISGDVILEDSQNCFVLSNNNLVVGLGLENLIIVQTEDAIMICERSHCQSIKKVVNILKKQNRSEPLKHLTKYNPWGYRTQLAKDKRFEVRLVTLKPGECIHTQKHLQRSEHWTILEGDAQIITSESHPHKQLNLTRGQSYFISPNTEHRIENPSQTHPLIFIEIQMGDRVDQADTVWV